MNQEIKKDLKDRYHNITVEKIINFATFLDLRYKELLFLDSFSKQEIIEQVEDKLISLECDTMDQQMVAEEEGEVAIEDEKQPVSKKKKGAISKLIGDLYEESNLTSPVGKASKKIELYKA